MKPCSKNRKLIAWLASDALDARKVATLRDHFTRCEGCRRYWEEISNATERVASAQPDSNIEASEFFHHRVAERLQELEYSSVPKNLAAWLHGLRLNWCVVLPTMAVLVISFIAVVAPRVDRAAFPSAPTTVGVVSSSDPESELAPTLANYQMVAHQSLEEFDELLSKHGNKRLPPVPVLTISSLELAQGAY
jgi:hypothetical protein